MGKAAGCHAPYDARYRRFFEEFNRQRYFEAHEVLEGLWLGTPGNLRTFYKGLIQTAAVFLKLEQGKPAPAARLAHRARQHLEPFRPVCQGLNVDEVLRLLSAVAAGTNRSASLRPRLELENE